MASETKQLPTGFWDAIRERPSRLLMLDYDGTLAPLRTERDEARVPPATFQALAEIVAGGASEVAVISGRRLADLERFLDPLRLHLVGEHGWEERAPDGRRTLHPLPPAAGAALERAAAVAAAEGWGERVERKRCSLVLHTRGLDTGTAEALERRCDLTWGEALGAPSLALATIHGGRELRARGHDKGVAAARLMAAAPGAYPVFVGDDLTDEDAFGVVGGHGAAIRVGRDPGGSSADYHLDSVADVPDFLRRWLAATQRAGT